MTEQSVPVTMYHNPGCGTSRNTLALIRNAGIEPTVIEYLKTPPDRTTLIDLLERMGMKPRALLREKGTPYAELGLASDQWSDAQLIDHMLSHPILINRPIVVTPWGVRLCRPSEAVLEILQLPRKGTICQGGRRARDRYRGSSLSLGAKVNAAVPTAPSGGKIPHGLEPIDGGKSDPRYGAYCAFPECGLSGTSGRGSAVKPLRFGIRMSGSVRWLTICRSPTILLRYRRYAVSP